MYELSWLGLQIWFAAGHHVCFLGTETTCLKGKFNENMFYFVSLDQREESPMIECKL